MPQNNKQNTFYEGSLYAAGSQFINKFKTDVDRIWEIIMYQAKF